MKTAYRLLTGTPERKRMFGRIRCRWEDNIKNGSFGCFCSFRIGSNECSNECLGYIQDEEFLFS
jgi:hypothetical protein